MSSWKAAANLVCNIEGVGLLSLPYALLEGGISSLVALVIVPIICYYTGRVLIKCLYQDQNGVKTRVYSSVEDLGEACWPKYGKKVIITLQNVCLVMVSTSYLVLNGSFLVHAFPTLQLTERMWIIVGAAVGFPTIFIKSLSKIAWISLVGVVALMVPIGIVLWYACARIALWEAKSMLLTDSEGVAIAVGIILFRFTAHALFPRIEGSMSTKESYNKMLGLTYIFVTVVKIIFGLCGFFTFKDKTQEVIVNNFPVGILFYVISGCLGVKVLCTYAFPIAVVLQSIDDFIEPGSCILKLPKMLWFVIIRVFLCLVTLLIALLVPHFSLFLAFLGSLFASWFAFVFTCLVHLKLRGSSISKVNRVFDYFIILVGLSGAVLGTYFSVKALARLYRA